MFVIGCYSWVFFYSVRLRRRRMGRVENKVLFVVKKKKFVSEGVFLFF